MTEKNTYYEPDADPNNPSPEQYYKALTELGFKVQSLFVEEGDTFTDELVPTNRGLRSRTLVTGDEKRRERFDDTR